MVPVRIQGKLPKMPVEDAVISVKKAPVRGLVVIGMAARAETFVRRRKTLVYICAGHVQILLIKMGVTNPHGASIGICVANAVTTLLRIHRVSNDLTNN